MTDSENIVIDFKFGDFKPAEIGKYYVVQENTERQTASTGKVTMKIDELTIGEARQLASMFSPSNISADVPGPWEIGKNYLIRTVTMIDTGRLVAVGRQELVLESAAWVADTGRFSGALQSCDFAEVEPFPEGRLILGRGSVIDAIQIPTLPTKQK